MVGASECPVRVDSTVSVFDRVHEPAHKIEVAVLGLVSKNMRTIAFLKGWRNWALHSSRD